MNIRDLQYFAAVAELRHFRKAAEKCFVSQPTLSGQLRKLEEELGLSLFERQPKGVRLTAAGENLLPFARAILDQSDRMAQAARALKDPRTGPLHLGVIPTLAPYLMPALVPFTHRLYPKVELFLSELRTSDLLQALEDGRVEAAVLATPVESAHFESEPVFTEPFCLAVHEKHPLARKHSLSVDDLAGQTLYLLEDGHCLKDQALEVCATAGAHEHPHFRGTSLETLRQMIGSGNGTTLMPWLAAQVPLGSAGSVRYLPFRDPKPHRNIAVAWRKGGFRSALLRDWARALAKHLGAK
ncbi:MAG: LysR family transcriptional regulator [Fibrobacteres bacterium]|nr:LysR family transcriptional regulator [Fibrobacterota bacterium]